MTRAYIAMGSNLGDRAAHLKQGRDAVAALAKTELLASSEVYETDPVGPAGQGAYLNAVIAVETERTARALLDGLLGIEQRQGRTRREKWGPRTLDLDLLLFGEGVIDQPGLVVPHPRLAERAFVLVPLADVAGGLVHPVNGERIADLLAACDRSGVRRFDVAGW